MRRITLRMRQALPAEQNRLALPASQVPHKCKVANCRSIRSWKQPSLKAVHWWTHSSRITAAAVSRSGYSQALAESVSKAEPDPCHPCAPQTRQQSEASTSGRLSFAGRKQLRDAAGRLMLKNLSYPELEEWCLAEGERRQRAHQLWRWMYHDRFWARSIDATADLQDGFGAAYREKIGNVATIDGGLELESVHTASDGTRKLLLRLTEGEGRCSSVEAVLIPIVRKAGSKPRITLCVSSQVGCAMNCQFCLTGRMGLMANLSTAQIVEQVVEARRLVAAEGQGATLTNVVFMGMGEPLQNLEAVLAALQIICHPLGLHFSASKVTVSTVGLVPQLQELCHRSKAQLAVSLHATTNEVRDWIAPVNRKWPLEALLAALEESFPRGGARSVFIEYVMLSGVNDSLPDARRLAELLEPVECKVNLIVFNPHEGTRFRPSEQDQLLAFRSVLIQAGRVCTVRDSRGDDEMAACGQLGVGKDRLAPMLRVPKRFEHALAAA